MDKEIITDLEKNTEHVCFHLLREDLQILQGTYDNNDKMPMMESWELGIYLVQALEETEKF